MITKNNERSLAIEFITEINLYIKDKDLPIKRAGGEKSVKTFNQTRFPDILLYGDNASGTILQGWELKLPDTNIDDIEFFENAKLKANTLGLNSFLLWNITYAKLYVRESEDDFKELYIWDDLSFITDRNMVEENIQKCYQQLYKIIDDLNNFFISGKITATSILESLDNDSFVNFILTYQSAVEEELIKEIKTNSKLDSEIILWWENVKSEFSEYKTPYPPLAISILMSWINKILFAHLLKSKFTIVHKVDQLNPTTDINTAINIFEEIANKCPYYTVFKSQLGEHCIPDFVWTELINLNSFLLEANLDYIPNDLNQKLQHSLIKKNKKKTAGQFTTPYPLAEILAAMTIENKDECCLDPCAGTGTIPKAIYKLKKSYHITDSDAIDKIYASDKFSFPLQLCTLNLSSTISDNKSLNIFKEDVCNIQKNMEIKLPNSSHPIFLPEIKYIVSNLPFVQQEDIRKLNPTLINEVNDFLIKTINQSLNGRSDLFAYIIIKLWNILGNDGKVGIITSNSWLGTEWGKTFFEITSNFFDFEYIITSGNGRWFKQAEVITNIIILKKKDKIGLTNPSINFITLKKNLSELVNSDREIDLDTLKLITAKIKYDKNSNEVCEKQSYTFNEIQSLNKYLSLNALFANVKWIFEINKKLIKANTLFEINRGERRGWDPLFYPSMKHNIDEEYLKPVILSPNEIYRYTTIPSSLAFCCTDSMNDLLKNRKEGTINWIKKFENSTNKVGKPLPLVLKRANLNWYSMSPNTLADLVMPISPNHRIFVSKLNEPAFVNQRLIRFSKKDPMLDIDLCHCLLNSILSVFFIEAIGFGRGLGVLDINTTKIKNQLYILNPSLLTSIQIKKIKEHFECIQNREILNIEDELKCPDRIKFEHYVLECFGLIDYKDSILKSFSTLFNIRNAIN